MSLKELRIKKGPKDEVNKIIGEYILLEDDFYNSNDYPHNWMCKCGNIIEGKRWSNIRYRGEYKCKSCNKKILEDFHKERVAKVDGYELLELYLKGDLCSDGVVVKGAPKALIMHKNCGNASIYGLSSFENDSYRCRKCIPYESSIAYYIENELGEPLETYWNFEENKLLGLDPYTTTKYSGKKASFKCKLKNKNHPSMERAVSDFVGNKGCSYCGTGYVEKKDSIAIKYPEIADMIINYEGDLHEIGAMSNKLFDFKCPKCGRISIQKKQLCNVVLQGYSCYFCSDGIPTTEKFMCGILEQLNIECEFQKKFSWSDNKVYDFYIPSRYIIIEVNGAQHSINKSFFGEQSLKDVRCNDKYKQNMARYNGIEVFYADAVKTEFEYLKQSYENTLREARLITDSNATSIEWGEAWLNSQKSLVVEVWDLWLAGLDTCDIEKRLNLARGTIIGYLKRGAESGKIEYSVKEQMRKSANRAVSKHLAIKYEVTNNGVRCIYNSQKELLSELSFSKGVLKKILSDGIVKLEYFRVRDREKFKYLDGATIKRL